MEMSGPYRATKLWNEAICIFKKGMPVKRHRRHMKFYDGTFSGIEAVNWFHATLLKTSCFGPDVTRDQVVRLLDKFLSANVFRSLKSGLNRSFKDNAELYQFVNDETLLPAPLTNPIVENKILKEKLTGMNSLPNLKRGNGKLVEIGKMEFENILWRSMFLRRLNIMLEDVDLKTILPMNTINCNYLILNCKYSNVGANFPQWLLEAINTLLLFDWPINNISRSPSYPGFETDIVQVIKDYFNSLSDPLIPYQFYDVFVSAYQYLDSVESRKSVYLSTNQRAMALTSRSVENLILGMSSPVKKMKSAKNGSFRNRDLNSSISSLSGSRTLSSALPQNACFETAFTSDLPTTRIVPKSSVDSVHLPLRKSTSSFPEDVSDHCEHERMELKPLKPMRKKKPVNHLCSQPNLCDTSDSENINPCSYQKRTQKKYFNRHPPPERQSLASKKCPTYEEAIKTLTLQRASKKSQDSSKESCSTLPKLIRRQKAEANCLNKNKSYEYTKKNPKYFSIAKCDELTDDFSSTKRTCNITNSDRFENFPCHNPKYKKMNVFNSNSSLDNLSEKLTRTSVTMSQKYRKDPNDHSSNHLKANVFSKSMERLAVNYHDDLQFDYGLALAKLHQLMERSRSCTPDTAHYLSDNENSLYDSDSESSNCSSEDFHQNKKSGWSDETVRIGQRIYQLLCLLLPPKNRAQLKLLLLLMSRLMMSPHSQVLYEISQGVLRENSADRHNDLAFFVVCFLLDHKDVLFKPPTDFINEIRSKARKCLNSSRKSPSFCEKVSSEEFEEQKLSGSQRALSELLDQILRDKKMDSKEKRKKLKMFQESYPHIYQLKFPADSELKTKSKSMVKFPSISKLKNLRI